MCQESSRISMVTPAEVFEAIRDEAGAVLIGNEDVL